MNNETISAAPVKPGRLKSRVLSASTLNGDHVFTPKGNKLGNIKELMIDIEKGRISYAVLSFGGLLGLGEKLFAVPWTAFTIDTVNKRFLLDIDEEALKNAPGFDADNWPNMADESWGKSINAFYSL
ncbi:MAG: PRC-barrel domain-containing protein [Shewanella oncorhynchi]